MDRSKNAFLGLLHMEVFIQRLQYEHEATCIATVPSVPYKIKLKSPKAIKEHRADEITIVSPEQVGILNEIQYNS